MKNLLKPFCIGIACCGMFIANQAANATTVFNNYDGGSAFEWKFYPDSHEVGDQILLAGQARIVTDFKFEYYGGNYSGDEAMQIRFYANDNDHDNNPVTAALPGTLLYDSGAFNISGFQGFADQYGRIGMELDYNTLLEYNGQPVIVPDIFTWTVQFSGTTVPGENAGVSIYNPPTTGWDYDSYWDNDPTHGWLLKTNFLTASPWNFAAKVEAVPEPNAIALGLGGALVVFLFRAGMRRS